MGDEKGYTIPIYINPVERGGTASNGSGSEEEYLPMQPCENGEDGQKNQQKTVGLVKSNANGAKAFARQLAGKVASTALNNYGNITGNYIAQQNIQNAISEISALGSAIALGPAGIAMYGVNKMIEGYNRMSQAMRAYTEAEFKRKRVFATEKKS